MKIYSKETFYLPRRSSLLHPTFPKEHKVKIPASFLPVTFVCARFLGFLLVCLLFIAVGLRLSYFHLLDQVE